MSLDFGASVDVLRRRISARITHEIAHGSGFPERLHDAMRYACDGGKRMRPLLVYATGQALGVPIERLDAAAAAVEMIHAYSLAHDDLPAMDNDELRRGQPTCHVKFDDATAILAGDALQALAFRVLASEARHPNPAEARTRMVAELAEAAGSQGMVGGQSIDLEAVGQTLTLAEIEAMHIRKTGALLRCAVRLGSLAADQAGDDVRAGLDRFGKRIGLAFQIQDDVLDEHGRDDVTGKAVGADRARDKPTYLTVMTASDARARAAELFDDAHQALAPLGDQGAPLHWMLDALRTRDA